MMETEHKPEILNALKNMYSAPNYDSIEAILDGKPYNDFAFYVKKKYANEKLSTLMDQYSEDQLKDEKLSEDFRKKGNTEFLNLKFQASLFLYIRALSFASTDSSKSLCFGNISATLLETEQYAGCLEAISNAKNLVNSQTDPFYKKLHEREQKCKQMMKVAETRVPNTLQLSYQANPKNPEIVDCIERGPNGGIFAKRDFKVTDIIAITKPFINGSNQKDWHSCENCRANFIQTGVVPCENCPFALYCSKECKADDDLFHKFICTDVHTSATRQEFIALKFAIKIMSKGVDIRKRNFEKPQKTCFDWSDGTIEERVESLCATRTIPIPKQKKFDILIMLFVFLDRMKKVGEFRDFLARFNNGEELFFKSYWKGFHILYSFSKTLDISKEKFLESNYFDLLAGFFNHHCIPNCIECRSPVTGETHYSIVNNVKAGEELFISFGGKGFFFDDRTEYLKTHFNMKCTCSVCTGGPTPDDSFDMGLAASKSLLVTQQISKFVNSKKQMTHSDFRKFANAIQQIPQFSTRITLVFYVFNTFYKSQTKDFIVQK